MNMTFIFLALFGVSITTNLTVQGIKTLLDTKNANYSSNILAVVTSTILSVGAVTLYCLYFNVPLDVKIGVETIVLVYLSFLVATNGYDKVIQTLKQIKDKAGELK